MNETDKKLAVDGIRVTGTTVLALINPLLAIPWELSFSLYGAVVERRKSKAEEWLTIFPENRDIFSESLVSNSSFQDAFINSFERYLRERNAEKRRLMRNIFLGLAKSKNLEEFPIERFYFVLDAASSSALRLLARIACMPEAKGTDFFQVERSEKAANSPDGESVHELVSLNILIEENNARFGPIHSPFVKLSHFGREFIRFISE